MRVGYSLSWTQFLREMEDGNVSKRIDATNQKRTAPGIELATRAVHRPRLVCRLDGRDVPDQQPQSVPDRHPGRKLSGTRSFCRVPVRPPAFEFDDAGNHREKFLCGWYTGCAGSLSARISITPHTNEPQSRPISKRWAGCWTRSEEHTSELQSRQ